jgi:hypothetical protein
MMTDFELKVLEELGEIKASVATTAQAQTDHSRRIGVLEQYNGTQEQRAWIKSLIVGAGVVVLHPLARKLGWDI